jgi:hypothetical protein
MTRVGFPHSPIPRQPVKAAAPGLSFAATETYLWRSDELTAIESRGVPAPALQKAEHHA